MTFHRSAFDLHDTFRAFDKKYKGAKVARKHFGLPIVSLADDVIANKYGVKGSEVEGIRRCLLSLTLRLRWRDHLWIIPMFERRPFFVWPYTGYSAEDKDTALLLVDSLML